MNGGQLNKNVINRANSRP